MRHHELSPKAKAWAIEAGRRLGHKVSGLAGLHAHFYLATMLLARPGDVGCFVTSAEWLEVGYGAALRALFLDGLGGLALHLVDPQAVTFEGVQTTAVVACFERGAQVIPVRVRAVCSAAAMHDLDAGRPVPRATLAASPRWTGLVRTTETVAEREGAVPLGSVVSVHRGLVTGANDYFVLGRQRARDLRLLPWCRPAITDAQEILQADGVLRDTPRRKMLLSVPRDIDRTDYPALDAYLRLGEAVRDGRPAVALRYIASHRKPWWYLGQPSPPPLVASYMARQAPAFALNPDGLALINIGHGLYPKGNLSSDQLAILCSHLNTARHTFRGKGRTYQGGLEKFEPREMEALSIDPTALDDA